jgi:chromosomal replication initiator protein
MSLPPGLWDGVLRRLGAELPVFAVDAWLRPLVAEPAGGGLRLRCPTPFHRDRVRERYLPAIRRCLAEERGGEVPVELALGAPVAPVCGGSQGRPEAAPAPAGRAAEPTPTKAVARVPPPVQRCFPYTFDSFVVGPNNALAREACYALARRRQHRLNPLFLTSDPGLGKTHLARAIVAEVRRETGPRALYASAEAFTNDFMRSVRGKRMDQFKQRYRSRCDLLVVEDVQFLGAKSATQLELFHTLSHLLDAGVRVVLTADRLPRDIEAMDGRLRSQMMGGFVAEIEPPDASVRRSILRAKAAHGGVRLPDDCLDLLVESVRGSVRDLEGVLIQLVESAALLKRPIDRALTRAALHKVAPRAPAPVPLDPAVVIGVVAAYFRTTPAALAARSRRRDVVVPRQLAMYLCRRYTDEPLDAIARRFGRHHSAVSNAVKVVERRILERAPARYEVEALVAKLEDRRGR